LEHKSLNLCHFKRKQNTINNITYDLIDISSYDIRYSQTCFIMLCTFGSKNWLTLKARLYVTFCLQSVKQCIPNTNTLNTKWCLSIIWLDFAFHKLLRQNLENKKTSLTYKYKFHNVIHINSLLLQQYFWSV